MKILFIGFAALMLISGCSRNQSKGGKGAASRDNDSALGMIVADTVIYDVAISNHNPDDAWSDQRLKRLDRSLMIDNIFNMVSKGNAIAYNHTTGEKLTPRQLTKMEEDKELDRKSIDMIQFKEIWYMNLSKPSITKKVISVVLGSQVFDNYGAFIGNRAVLRVELE